MRVTLMPALFWRDPVEGRGCSMLWPVVSSAEDGSGERPTMCTMVGEARATGLPLMYSFGEAPRPIVAAAEPRRGNVPQSDLMR